MLRKTVLAALAMALSAFGQQTVTRSIPAQAGGRLALRAEFGSLNLRTAASNSIEIEVSFRGRASQSEFDRMLKDFTLDVNQQGSEVRVEGRFVNGWTTRGSGFFSGRRHCQNGRCLEYDWLRDIEYRIVVPREFNADLRTSGGSIAAGDLNGSLAVRTSGGSLDIGSVRGPVDGYTSGGSIRVTGSQGRAILHTSGGSIHIDDASGDIDAETSGGSIQIRRVGGTVRAHTSGGSIDIGDATGAITAETSGGGISVRMPASRGFNIDARTSGGGVSTDFSVSPSRRRESELQAAVNGGGPTLHLRTSGGGISIRKGN